MNTPPVVHRGRTATRRVAAALLMGSGTVFLAGALMYTGRTFWAWPADGAYVAWERGFVIAGVLISVGGFALLELLLREARAVIVPRLAFVTYFAGCIVLVSAEASNIFGRGLSTAQTTLFVVLAIVAQVGFGVALIVSRIVPTWVGWAVIVWNLGAGVLLFALSPSNVYFPFVHFVAPLLIGVALLTRAKQAPVHGTEQGPTT